MKKLKDQIEIANYFEEYLKIKKRLEKEYLSWKIHGTVKNGASGLFSLAAMSSTKSGIVTQFLCSYVHTQGVF